MIERGLADVFLQIEEVRANAIEAAEVKRDLADLRLSQSESDRRTQQTLERRPEHGRAAGRPSRPDRDPQARRRRSRSRPAPPPAAPRTASAPAPMAAAKAPPARLHHRSRPPPVAAAPAPPAVAGAGSSRSPGADRARSGARSIPTCPPIIRSSPAPRRARSPGDAGGTDRSLRGRARTDQARRAGPEREGKFHRRGATGRAGRRDRSRPDRRQAGGRQGRRTGAERRRGRSSRNSSVRCS